MKILLLYPFGKNKNPYSNDNKEYDFDTTYMAIKNNLANDFPNVTVDSFTELKIYNNYHDALDKTDYDLYLCDITTYNGNFLYMAGLLDGLNKPLVFCSSSDHPPLPVTITKLCLFYSESTLNNEFKTRLNSTILSVMNNTFNSYQIEESKQKTKVFISYSHVDVEYLNRLLIHLKPLEKQKILDVWQDKRLKVGDKWVDQINNALEHSTIAILLISADFLASDFIVNNELPPLLKKAQVNGTKILPIILTPCRFLREKELSQFQAINEATKPLSLMNINDREIYYDKLANAIEESLNLTKN